MDHFVSGIALGLDSFLACTVIGAHLSPWRERGRLVIAFGACDAIATLLGPLTRHRSTEVSSITVLAVCVILIFAFTRRNRSWLYAVPLLLSFDNLFSGAPANIAPALGLNSALMAAVGLYLGAVCRHMFQGLGPEA